MNEHEHSELHKKYPWLYFLHHVNRANSVVLRYNKPYPDYFQPVYNQYDPVHDINYTTIEVTDLDVVNALRDSLDEIEKLKQKLFMLSHEVHYTHEPIPPANAPKPKETIIRERKLHLDCD